MNFKEFVDFILSYPKEAVIWFKGLKRREFAYYVERSPLGFQRAVIGTGIMAMAEEAILDEEDWDRKDLVDTPLKTYTPENAAKVEAMVLNFLKTMESIGEFNKDHIEKIIEVEIKELECRTTRGFKMRFQNDNNNHR